ncbi:MAG: hypothetical protein F6K17_27250, partial [Okeania sp. SIO3C4]|nr:hypothetical protein [Okeania sp. SIO3C4]
NATAIAFSAEFYRRLAQGEPVDIAAQNGRYYVALETEYLGNDFATPVIFMRVEDGYLFQKKKIESDVLSEAGKYKKFANTTNSNIVENKPIDDNNYVYLAIDLKLESAKIQKNDPDKYWVKTWLAIPESFQKFSFENLLNTFKPDKTYSQADIEENISELIKECNDNLEEILPEKYPKIAIEWILPGDLLSLPVDCWEYRKNTRIGCNPRFYSVHIRSSQRLNFRHYRDCYQSWKDKWDDIQKNIQNINLSNYILTCECQLENSSYELMIEMGIPIALWSRCKESNVNHFLELDELINPNNENVLNIQKLPKYVENKRLAACSNEPNHLGHHLCFLSENPYNYPKKRRLGFGY